jgi:hypothetical protein
MGAWPLLGVAFLLVNTLIPVPPEGVDPVHDRL